ncbi:transposase [Nocardia takedensis]
MSPVDRRKTGSKHHILTCGNGLPLAITLSAANVNDHLVLPELLDNVSPLRGRPGRPRRRITTLTADKGYDYPRVYNELRQRGIAGYIPRRGTRDKVSGRWIIEQFLALLAPIPTLRDPLGTPHRHPPQIPRPRSRTHLLATVEQPNPIGALNVPMRHDCSSRGGVRPITRVVNCCTCGLFDRGFGSSFQQ